MEFISGFLETKELDCIFVQDFCLKGKRIVWAGVNKIGRNRRKVIQIYSSQTAWGIIIYRQIKPLHHILHQFI